MLKSDSPERDESLFWKRVILTGCVALLFFVGATMVSTAFAVLFVFLGLAALAVPIVDAYWTDQEAGRRSDRKAIDEYLGVETPSKRAGERIFNDLELLKELGSHPGEINRVNEIGRRLLSPELLEGNGEMEQFQLIARNGYDFLQTTGVDPLSGFERLVGSKHLKKLQWLLEEKILTPERLTGEQTLHLWICIGSLEAGQLLVHHGFNVDYLDAEGCSPLYTLIRNPQMETRLEKPQLFQVLLSLGADTLRTVTLQGAPYHAFSLNHAVKQEIERQERARQGGARQERTRASAQFEQILLAHHRQKYPEEAVIDS